MAGDACRGKDGKEGEAKRIIRRQKCRSGKVTWQLDTRRSYGEMRSRVNWPSCSFLNKFHDEIS
eukprot:754657-Hanusia_phi.AAC.2